MEREVRANYNIVDFRQTSPIVVGDNTLKAEYWETHIPLATNVIDIERYKNNPLREQIRHFDNNWREEGLSKEWYRIDDVGFSSKRQMSLLRNEGNLEKWTDQTGQDLLGFGLEYLSQGTIFPFEYQIENGELIDKKYGGRKMRDTVDPNERNGAVLDSLAKIEEHLLFRSEGSSAIMISPPGSTGLIMDDGSAITYKDTMVFHFQKKGDKVIGTTIRSDINLEQAKQLIESLTGSEMIKNASAEDCTRTPVLFEDDSSISAEEILDKLQELKGSVKIYNNKTFIEAREDLHRREELYLFDDITQTTIDQFKQYVLEGNHSEKEIQKAMAATFLRISKHLLIDKQQKKLSGQMGVIYEEDYLQKPVNMGFVLQQVRDLPGCMGGGGSITAVNSIITRIGIVDKSVNYSSSEDEYGSLEFTCPYKDCKKTNIRPKHQLIANCQHCGKSVKC